MGLHYRFGCTLLYVGSLYWGFVDLAVIVKNNLLDFHLGWQHAFVVIVLYPLCLLGCISHNFELIAMNVFITLSQDLSFIDSLDGRIPWLRSNKLQFLLHYINLIL